MLSGRAWNKHIGPVSDVVLRGHRRVAEGYALAGKISKAV